MQEMVIKNKSNKNFFYEAATSIAVSGVYLSRKVFCRYLKNCSCINQNEIQEVKGIVQKYVQLRFLFLKYYIATNDENLKLILDQLREIKKRESSVYERINRNIKM